MLQMSQILIKFTKHHRYQHLDHVIDYGIFIMTLGYLGSYKPRLTRHDHKSNVFKHSINNNLIFVTHCICVKLGQSVSVLSLQTV